MATPAQIRDRAATRLGILGEGEVLPSYESADLTAAYAEVYAKLDTIGLAVWEYTENIPDEYAGHVVDLVAEARINDYGIPNDRYSRISASAKTAILGIKEQQASNSYVTPTPDYF